MAETPPTTTTTTPSTQPTVPAARQFGATTTTVPTRSSTPAAGNSRVSPDLTRPGILTEEDGDFSVSAIGVRGRRLYDAQGKLIRYEGYKYQTGARYPTTSGAGAATGTPMVVTQREPQYFAGDEDKIFALSIEDLSNLQRAMNAVGLLGDNYSPGVADGPTRAAYYNLLEEANGYGEDTDATILRRAALGGGPKGQLTQYRVSNELDIKNVINRVSQQALGRKLGEGDLTRLAKMYRELEKQAGLAAGSDTIQQVETAPSPEAFAESQLGQMFPDETNARQFGSYLEAIKERYQV